MLKNEVLKKLIAEDGYISGQEISSCLGVSRTSVWKSIEALRKDGFIIDSRTHMGYCLKNSSDILLPATIRPYVQAQRLGREIFCVEKVDSTNNYLKNLAASGAKDGTVVISDSQTGGRGRFGRAFSSPPGKGVYLSVLLRPPYSPGELEGLTCYTAVAICEAIEAASGISPAIKWVNDIIFDGKKICGILTEMALESESGQIQYIVIGAGVNVLNTPEDFPDEVAGKAASLAMLGSPGTSRPRLAAEMINSLDRMYNTLPNPGEAFWEKYRERSVTLGHNIRIVSGQNTREAFAQDIDPTGGLIVRYPDGSRETLSYGEISVRGVDGYI